MGRRLFLFSTVATPAPWQKAPTSGGRFLAVTDESICNASVTLICNAPPIPNITNMRKVYQCTANHNTPP